MRTVLNHKRTTISHFPGVCEGNVDPRLYGDDITGTEGLALGHAAAIVHIHTLNIEYIGGLVNGNPPDLDPIHFRSMIVALPELSVTLSFAQFA
jgi:hypothetical protein